MKCIKKLLDKNEELEKRHRGISQNLSFIKDQGVAYIACDHGNVSRVRMDGVDAEQIAIFLEDCLHNIEQELQPIKDRIDILNELAADSLK